MSTGPYWNLAPRKFLGEMRLAKHCPLVVIYLNRTTKKRLLKHESIHFFLFSWPFFLQNASHRYTRKANCVKNGNEKKKVISVCTELWIFHAQQIMYVSSVIGLSYWNADTKRKHHNTGIGFDFYLDPEKNNWKNSKRVSGKWNCVLSDTIVMGNWVD